MTQGVPKFSAWVPEIASLTIVELLETDYFQDNLPHRAALSRLALDPRMESVWIELLRRQRNNYAPSPRPMHNMSVFPEWNKFLKRAGANPQHQMPRVLLIYLATMLRVNPTLPTRDAVTVQIANMKAVAKQCLELARAGEPSANWQKWGAFWNQQAKLLKRQSSNALLLDRQRTPPEVAGIIRGVILTMNSLFGSSMYRTASTIASVITNSTVTSKQIEKHAEMLKGIVQKQ